MHLTMIINDLYYKILKIPQIPSQNEQKNLEKNPILYIIFLYKKYYYLPVLSSLGHFAPFQTKTNVLFAVQYINCRFSKQKVYIIYLGKRPTGDSFFSITAWKSMKERVGLRLIDCG